MPRLILRKPAHVIVGSYLGSPLVVHLPMLPEGLVPNTVAMTACGALGDVWGREVWNRRIKVCAFCRRNAASLAALHAVTGCAYGCTNAGGRALEAPAQPAPLLGPERSEGPSLAPRRRAATLGSRTQVETLPANRHFLSSGSGGATPGAPESTEGA